MSGSSQEFTKLVTQIKGIGEDLSSKVKNLREGLKDRTLTSGDPITDLVIVGAGGIEVPAGSHYKLMIDQIVEEFSGRGDDLVMVVRGYSDRRSMINSATDIYAISPPDLSRFVTDFDVSLGLVRDLSFDYGSPGIILETKHHLHRASSDSVLVNRCCMLTSSGKIGTWRECEGPMKLDFGEIFSSQDRFGFQGVKCFFGSDKIESQFIPTSRDNGEAFWDSPYLDKRAYLSGRATLERLDKP